MRRLQEKACGSRFVFGRAVSIELSDRELHHRVDVAADGSLLHETHRLAEVLLCAAAFFIHSCKRVLRFGVAGFRRNDKKFGGTLEVLRKLLTLEIKQSEIISRARVPKLGGRLQQTRGIVDIARTGAALEAQKGTLAYALVHTFLPLMRVALLVLAAWPIFAEEPAGDETPGFIPRVAVYVPEGQAEIRLSKLVRSSLYETQFEYDFVSGDIAASITQILAHSKFADCNVNRTRQWGHLLLFYAFAGLAVVTTWAIIYLYGFELLGIQPFGPFHFGESPYPNSDPVKILALASSIAFAAGVVILLMNRFAQAGKAGIGSYFDWIFLTMVIGVGATGMLSWALRLADMNAGYLVYYFHLVFIWALFAYAPYSKFAHLFYRTTAMVFARRSGRDRK